VLVLGVAGRTLVHVGTAEAGLSESGRGNTGRDISNVTLLKTHVAPLYKVVESSSCIHSIPLVILHLITIVYHGTAEAGLSESGRGNSGCVISSVTLLKTHVAPLYKVVESSSCIHSIPLVILHLITIVYHGTAEAGLSECGRGVDLGSVYKYEFACESAYDSVCDLVPKVDCNRIWDLFVLKCVYNRL
jgi:hypothetical protein